MISYFRTNFFSFIKNYYTYQVETTVELSCESCSFKTFAFFCITYSSHFRFKDFWLAGLLLWELSFSSNPVLALVLRKMISSINKAKNPVILCIPIICPKTKTRGCRFGHSVFVNQFP